jgi:hypothetical protein
MNKNKKVIIIVLAFICLITSFIIVLHAKRLISVAIEGEGEWSIGIYISENPFYFSSSQSISNPVLSATDVTDIPAKFVADPFMLYENNTWYMFFEVYNSDTDQGDIGLAMSNDGLNWTYKQIVLDEQFHLSYPCVFKWNNEYYMIPETSKKKSIRLYKANNFPKGWSFIKTLIGGKNYVDPTIFRYNDKWWLFAGIQKNDTLYLYYSDNLMGPWTEHPYSPIIKGDANTSRPGGRIMTFNGRVIRYAQDDYPIYGNQVRAFEIDMLTTTNYKEHEIDKSPILIASGHGWNAPN